MYRATPRPHPFLVVAAFALALAASLATAGHVAASCEAAAMVPCAGDDSVDGDQITRLGAESAQEGEEEQRSGAVVPSELSERSLTGSYVVTAGAVAIVVALIVAQRVRNRRTD